MPAISSPGWLANPPSPRRSPRRVHIQNITKDFLTELSCPPGWRRSGGFACLYAEDQAALRQPHLVLDFSSSDEEENIADDSSDSDFGQANAADAMEMNSIPTLQPTTRRGSPAFALDSVSDVVLVLSATTDSASTSSDFILASHVGVNLTLPRRCPDPISIHLRLRLLLAHAARNDLHAQKFAPLPVCPQRSALTALLVSLGEITNQFAKLYAAVSGRGQGASSMNVVVYFPTARAPKR
ncbi:hypothetical protein B0H11DRAFT_2216667 [Mycena galericulata]|nr:hypothetical protein B0H11DRAFT_2216667 [Mycena galericulata]